MKKVISHLPRLNIKLYDGLLINGFRRSMLLWNDVEKKAMVREILLHLVNHRKVCFFDAISPNENQFEMLHSSIDRLFSTRSNELLQIVFDAADCGTLIASADSKRIDEFFKGCGTIQDIGGRKQSSSEEVPRVGRKRCRRTNK